MVLQKGGGWSNEFFHDSPPHYFEGDYEEYRKDVVFSPKTPRILAFLAFAGCIVGAVHGILELVDAYILNGVRYATHATLLYIVLHVCWLWVDCRLKTWKASKRGITLIQR